MKNPNVLQKHRERLLKRWSEEDYPGGTPRFQLSLLVKDIVVFCLIPVCAIIFYKLVESSISGPRKPTDKRRTESKVDRNEKHSQIIQFQSSGNKTGKLSFSKRAPGSLVRVRLMNTVETYSSASVHAQIVDAGLGSEFLGGTIVGDASPDGNTGKIKIDFKFVRHPKRLDLAVPVSARAMSLDGTLGVNGTKKEGFFARAAIRSASGNNTGIDKSGENQDLKTLVARALAAGLMQEFQTEAGIENNKAQVLTLSPMTEFFVELTDYFPGQK